MRQRAWTTRGALIVAGACGAALLTACGGGQPESGSTSSPTIDTSSAATSTSAAPATLQVSDEAAQNLCDMMRPELSNWRVQGPTLGRASLNLMVHEWALTNGIGNAALLTDKAVVDRVTTDTCADARTQALEALELPDLASGLIL